MRTFPSESRKGKRGWFDEVGRMNVEAWPAPDHLPRKLCVRDLTFSTSIWSHVLVLSPTAQTTRTSSTADFEPLSLGIRTIVDNQKIDNAMMSLTKRLKTVMHFGRGKRQPPPNANVRGAVRRSGGSLRSRAEQQKPQFFTTAGRVRASRVWKNGIVVGCVVQRRLVCP